MDEINTSENFVYVNGKKYVLDIKFLNRKTATGFIEDDKICLKLPLRLNAKDKIKYISILKRRLIKRIIDGQIYRELRFKDGDLIHITDRSFLIHSSIDQFIKRPMTKLTGNLLYVVIPASEATKANYILNDRVIKFLIKLVLPYVIQRVNHINNEFFGFKVSRIKVYRPKKVVLGSCNYGNKTLSFNLRIFLCPENIIDSVIVHELCHLKVPNHSQQFWKLLYSVMPDYDEYRKWINKNLYSATLPNRWYE
ncbi:putative metal-dependent hydrolase [Candidatus Mancarchaeum acidiphilum]|uniref:Putative metal-dependent hydrolase n=1 Tax=Candidatus Mancarchaeum acidiphilum TaxID=1920749 RepID=A0A218NM99_9ARCH|nr:M48 family metallopeptidase [Candidatus Mancarchaeum acidiphilum]ASI13600.1 putative metal-dependent hydrolase [Candidatus Mancarchaeum acidiphilum]